MSRRKRPSSFEPTDLGDRCCVAPSPQLRERIRERLRSINETPGVGMGRPRRLPAAEAARLQRRRDHSRARSIRSARRCGASAARPRRARRCAATVRVIVVLVDFSDAPMTATPDHFKDLFFSTGKIPTGSVREYYTEVTHGLLTLDRRSRRPVPAASHARRVRRRASPARTTPSRTPGRWRATPRCWPNADVDFAPYDNDGNGFVDAFIVVHAGRGAEETGNENDIWSHKWVFTGGAARRRRHEDLRLPDDSRELQDRRLRARARPPALRLAGPVRHRRIERRPGQLVPDGRRQLERRRRHPGASLGVVQGRTRAG